MLRAGSGSYYRLQQAASAPGFTLLFSNSAGGALRTTLVSAAECDSTSVMKGRHGVSRRVFVTLLCDAFLASGLAAQSGSVLALTPAPPARPHGRRGGGDRRRRRRHLRQPRGARHRAPLGHRRLIRVVPVRGDPLHRSAGAARRSIHVGAGAAALGPSYTSPICSVPPPSCSARESWRSARPPSTR